MTVTSNNTLPTKGVALRAGRRKGGGKNNLKNPYASLTSNRNSITLECYPVMGDLQLIKPMKTGKNINAYLYDLEQRINNVSPLSLLNPLHVCPIKLTDDYCNSSISECC